MKSTKNEVPDNKLSSWASRNLIALIITGLVVGVTVFIAVYLLFHPDRNADGTVVLNISFIGQTLLPLWGTWIGTVLAFYFGKANFEAASQSYREAMKAQTPEEKISLLAVKDTMLPVKEIVYLDLSNELDKTISTILTYDRFKLYNRFAVLDQQMMVKFMIHRAVFYQFLFTRYNEMKAAGKAPDTDLLTLRDLIESNDEQFKKPLNRGVGFVSINANLLEAKRVMDATEECFDVFVTQSGKASEPILGLLTNNRIFQYAKV